MIDKIFDEVGESRLYNDFVLANQKSEEVY